MLKKKLIFVHARQGFVGVPANDPELGLMLFYLADDAQDVVTDNSISNPRSRRLFGFGNVQQGVFVSPDFAQEGWQIWTEGCEFVAVNLKIGENINAQETLDNLRNGGF